MELLKVEDENTLSLRHVGKCNDRFLSAVFYTRRSKYSPQFRPTLPFQKRFCPAASFIELFRSPAPTYDVTQPGFPTTARKEGSRQIYFSSISIFIITKRSISFLVN